MKRSLSLLVFLFTCICSYSQDVNEVINSLKLELKNNPDAKRTATIYSDLTWYYSNVSIDSALNYGSKAIQESKKLNDSILLAQVYSDVGAVYFRKGDFQNSKRNYLQAYAVRKIIKDTKGLAKINNNLANVYLNLQQYELAMKSFLDALNYFESINDELNVNVTKSNIGLLQIQLNNYPKAIKYLKEAIKYNEKNSLHDRLCESYLNLGKAYGELKDTVNATKYFNKSLKNCKLTGNKKAISIVYQSLGLRQQKAEVSKKLYEESKKYSDGFNSDLDKANLQLSVARNHIALKEFKQAQAILLKIKKIFEVKKSKEDLLFTYKLLVPVFAHFNQPDSVVLYNDKYTSLSQELIQISVLKQTSELEAKYQTEKKEKLLLQTKADVQKKNTLFYSALILALFIAIIAFLIYRQQKLKNKQQEQEFELKTAISKIETQNKLQEQRLTISRDLHDNIGAQLTFIISSVDNIKHGFDIQNIKLNNKLKYISEFTKSTIVELRDTIWAMNNNEIHFEDLRARILNFTEKAKFAKENIDFNFVIDDQLNQEKLSSVVGMNIYRTIQEAVNNAIKYSDASEITINVANLENLIVIAVSDNGKGFDFETTEIGNGLHNMQKRIEDIGGIFNVSSEISKGTNIKIEIEKQFLNK
ncbi:MAG: tetratricopeptide repeat protein [Flavobacterium sp.]|nr:MAG: tetratricopeptide repeat protein [Flavobacterium sp.]